MIRMYDPSLTHYKYLPARPFDWTEKILHKDQSAGFQEYIIGMPDQLAGYDSLLILLPPGDRYPNHQSAPNRSLWMNNLLIITFL